MPGPYSAAFRTDIDALIQGAWPEFATMPENDRWLWRSQMGRMEWIQLERDNELTLPFVIVDVGNSDRPKGVPMTAIWYGAIIRLAYILAEDVGSMEVELDGKMDSAEEWLIANYRTTFSAIQPRGRFLRDIGMKSQENEDLLQLKLPDGTAVFAFEAVWPGTNAP